MTAYYNEIDQYAAEWLRNLIKAGHIAPGVVDERSIEDVTPNDIREFTQCHFFAGVGVWSLALRRANWADDVRVWTGSCPCQPFSAAGAGAGFSDKRHLWPAFNHLISQCRPPVVFGEQVASKAVEPWIDLVHADLEALGYAFGGVPFPSAGVGAPHIRDRLFWVANSESVRSAGKLLRAGAGLPPNRAAQNGRIVGMAGAKLQQRPEGEHAIGHEHDAGERIESAAALAGLCSNMRPGQTNGFWRDSDWLGCRDAKWRAVEPGTFPLANGAASRVGRLRAYGNAINAQAAQAFIESFTGI
jgi:DNA (cytosine-5)-methyltransferase 1